MNQHLQLAIVFAPIGALSYKKKPKSGQLFMIMAASQIIVGGFEPFCQFIQSLF